MVWSILPSCRPVWEPARASCTFHCRGLNSHSKALHDSLRYHWWYFNYTLLTDYRIPVRSPPEKSGLTLLCFSKCQVPTKLISYFTFLYHHWSTTLAKLTFGNSFLTMLSHTLRRRALSCSIDKCFFLDPGGGVSWENLAKTLVWWWWRRGDSSEESSSSRLLFFFTFFNLPAWQQ